MTTKTMKADVPVEAFRFTGDVSIEKAEKPAPGENVPFNIFARSPDPIPHWWWGMCVHDMAGMKSSGTFSVDYAHDYGEAIGFSDKQSASNAGLFCSGALTPFTPDDRASEIANKSSRGVPYQASIDFDEYQIVIEDVPAGMSTEVNGKTHLGPLTVFREWTLNGLAICLHGIDGSTSVQFSKDKLSGKQVAVTRFTKGAKPMAGDATTSETPPADTETPETEETPATDTTTVETPTTETAPPAATKLSRKEQAKQFTDEFGDEHGVTLFAKCETIEEGRTEFAKLILAENAKLKTQLSKKPAGAEKPASFGGSEKPQLPTKFAHLGSNIGRFANGIKLPGAKSTS